MGGRIFGPRRVVFRELHGHFIHRGGCQVHPLDIRIYVRRASGRSSAWVPAQLLLEHRAPPVVLRSVGERAAGHCRPVDLGTSSCTSAGIRTSTSTASTYRRSSSRTSRVHCFEAGERAMSSSTRCADRNYLVEATLAGHHAVVSTNPIAALVCAKTVALAAKSSRFATSLHVLRPPLFVSARTPDSGEFAIKGHPKVLAGTSGSHPTLLWSSRTRRPPLLL